jgi:hypothetical protein
MHASHHADLLETFTHSHSSQLIPEDIYIPPHLQPLNPEDEDDVVPDQHAAFGIQRATQTKREPLWRDLGLEELMRRGPGESGDNNARVGGAAGGSGGAGSASTGRVGGGMRGLGSGRTQGRDEPVALALRRRPGAGSVALGLINGGGEVQSGGGGGAGNGLPR